MSSTSRRLPRRWADTLSLPRSTLPSRAAPAAAQAIYLRQCTEDLYRWQQNHHPQRGEFVLGDGPPFANGYLHIGHALNKILKDITCRVQLQQGRRVRYVPGWDCHGLPIEMAVVKDSISNAATNIERSTAGQAQLSAIEIRNEARQRASKVVQLQKAEFKSWGIMADWDAAWTTMDSAYEIKQLEVFRQMVASGLIRRQFKPVYWSPSTRTALAEGELEYRDDHISQAAYVKYPIVGRQGVSLLIWTTLPWTLPANVAIGIHAHVDYVQVQLKNNDRLIMARPRLPKLLEILRDEQIGPEQPISVDELLTLKYSDSMWTAEPQMKTLILAEHVNDESGSGLAHLAPGHGPEDYQIGRSHGLIVHAPVDDDGKFTAAACPARPALLEGKSVLGDGNMAALDHVRDMGFLVRTHKYVHKYPYDWRSKQPVILRATSQWFAGSGQLQQKALQALENVRFVPSHGKGRLAAFVRDRSEWCISRQRAWGVPIPALFHKTTGQALMNDDSISRIIEVIGERGIDAWWTDPINDSAWLPPGCHDYIRGLDTMDVWFDSGTSWTQTKDIADIYLEGSDQHRGWFQSSLLTYVASKSKRNAPFKTLITHGFILDKASRKMSKSEGNVVAPNDIIYGLLLPPTKKGTAEALGVDALRLWVAGSDFTKDVAVSPDGLQLVHQTLLKLRATFKQLLGILHGWMPDHKSVPFRLYSKHHQLAIFQVERMAKLVQQYHADYEYQKAVGEIARYVNADLSAFYFEAIKDAAYCGTATETHEVHEAIAIIWYRLLQVLAPFTPLLVQEVYSHASGTLKTAYPDPPHHTPWTFTHRSEVTTEAGINTDMLPHLVHMVRQLQEVARVEKKMGSPLQSSVHFELLPDVQDSHEATKQTSFFYHWGHDLASILVVSDVSFGTLPPELPPSAWHHASTLELPAQSIRVHVFAPFEQKCKRCWRYMAPLTEPPEEALCRRCDTVLQKLCHQQPDLFF